MFLILLFFYLSICAGISFIAVYSWEGAKVKLNPFKQVFFALLFISSWIIFVFALSEYKSDFYHAIDPMEQGYTPFSNKHFLTIFTFVALSIFGLYSIWKKGKNIPPLRAVAYISFIIIGIVICFFTLIQIGFKKEIYYVYPIETEFLLLAPTVHILVSFMLLLKFIRLETTISESRSFKNKWLNFLNQKLTKSGYFSIWTLIILLPMYLLIALFLMLFGQDYNSLTKAFTETTTWYFSEKTHPPFLDHEGHYLCTVAACGDPKIVKPLRLGIRHGNEIIVNRQLLIANAFEDVIMQKAPKSHKLIRSIYDKYGYPLSKNITSRRKSNATYFAMKPLEWLFLLVLYFTCNKPEELIRNQYKMNSI